MNALIIEDEYHAALRLQKFIHEIEPNMQILSVLEGIDETVSWWKNHKAPDLVFLDIHLSDGNCFEIFNHIDLDCPIIFATAYDEYALQAFNQHAFDYILKPIKKVELERAINKVKRYGAITNDRDVHAVITDQLTGEDTLRRLLVRIGPKITLLKMEDVAYFYSKDKITFAVTKQDRRYPLDKSLEYLEKHLGHTFFRINRKFIIQLDAIASMIGHTKGRVKIELYPASSMEIVVSTDRSRAFKNWLVTE